jgi:hypothetical protein
VSGPPPRIFLTGQTQGIYPTGERPYPVTAATFPGETLLLLLGSNNASVAVTRATDTKGNTWILDREHTVGPYTEVFRCDGPTGGPGGGPSAALAPGDIITIYQTGTLGTSVTMGLLGVADQLGALNEPLGWNSPAAVQLVTVSANAVAGGRIIALFLSQSAGVAASLDPPVNTLISILQGHIYTAGYLDVPAPALVTVTGRVTTAANVRLGVYSFLPSRLPPLKVWDGSQWRGVARV